MTKPKSATRARANPDEAQRKLLAILGVQSIEEAVRAVQGRAPARRPLTVNVERVDFTDPLRLLRAAELAALLSIHIVTVHKWVRVGKLPKPVRIGRVTAWRACDIAEWLDRQQAADEPAPVSAD